jgi:5-methylcytosine-specific restriction protein A
MMFRPSAADRGYDARWQRRRRRYLRTNPTCALCPAPAEVPDHWPISRRDLVARGVTNPDADERLRPLCTSCHNRATGRNQPGGWNAWPTRKREKPPHPGLIA